MTTSTNTLLKKQTVMEDPAKPAVQASVTILEAPSDFKLKFVIRGVDLSVANAIRRVVLSEIDNVAVVDEDVRMISNTCPLHDGILSKRVAMVPLKLTAPEVSAYVPGSLTLSLNVTNESALPLDVTTKDVVAYLHGTEYPDMKRLLPKNEVSGDHILLTRLQPGQELKFSATATKGTPSKHASYASVCVASYGYEEDEDAIAEARAALVAASASLDEKEVGNALNRFDCIDRQRIFKKRPDGSPNGFVFAIESESGFTSVQVVETAFEKIRVKFKNPGTSWSFMREDPTYVKYVIEGESHTFGGIIQSVAVDYAESLGVMTAGFYRPHPLEDDLVFKVKFAAAPADPAAAFKEMCDLCILRVDAAAAAFGEATVG